MKVSNDKLYEMAESEPLTAKIENRRLKMIENVIMMDENTPASLSLQFALNNFDNLRGRRGKPKSNLLTQIQSDLKKRGIKLENMSDLYNIQDQIKAGLKISNH